MFVFIGSNPKITLGDNWDRSIRAMTWSNDGQSLFLELGEEARTVIYKLSDLTSANLSFTRLLHNGTSISIDIHPTNNDIFVFAHESILQPANIYLYTSSISVRPLTNHNENLLSKVRMSNLAEAFSFVGARNETVWGWHIPPANGTNQKAPLAFVIHGGPQSSFYDS